MARSRNPSPLRPLATSNPSYRPDAMSPVDNEHHPVIHAGRAAVITGAASGIGRAAALELAKLGLKIALADVDEARLEAVGKEVLAIHKGEAANVLVIPTDVSQLDQVVALKDRVCDAWGEVAVLLNNAGIGPKGTGWKGMDAWKQCFDVNVFGMINVQHTFVPVMLHQENPGMIINTGSKQGITNPPGNAAYNASKAAVKSLTEGLAHELRERPHSNLTAHLFIPGWTYTGMSGANDAESSKPDGAFTAEECVLFMLDAVRNGEFYVLVPDNDTPHVVDQLRVMWAAGDVAEGRPALSRWHPTYKSLFEEFMKDGLSALEKQ